jgi:hypothetical protein
MVFLFDLLGYKCLKNPPKNCSNHTFRAVLITLCVLTRFFSFFDFLGDFFYLIRLWAKGPLFFAERGVGPLLILTQFDLCREASLRLSHLAFPALIIC